MRLVFVLFLLSAFALTDGAQFLSPLPDGTVLYACAARSVTLNWQYALSQGDQINHVRWYYEGSHNALIAYYSRGSFLTLPAFATKVEFVSNGGLQLKNLNVSDSGKYFVEISGIDRNLTLFQHQRHVLLYVADGLRTTNGRLAVSLQKDPILDTTTREWSMVLSCGRFTYSGQPAFPIEWVTPSGRAVWSSKYESGYFKLHLTTSSVEGGRYVCRVPTSYTSSACLNQAAAEQVAITVDKVDAQLTITNAELRSLTLQANALTQRVVAGETEVRSLRQDVSVQRASLSSLWATHRADNATLHSRMTSYHNADRADACPNYTLLDDYTRSVTYGNVNRSKCDSGMAFGWYRFQINGSNAVVPTSCGGPTWNQICDCTVPVWLDLQGAALPAVGQEIPALGCASWSGNCCRWNSTGTWTPLVRNCGGFYVFKLRGLAVCSARWCAQLGTY